MWGPAWQALCSGGRGYVCHMGGMGQGCSALNGCMLVCARCTRNPGKLQLKSGRCRQGARHPYSVSFVMILRTPQTTRQRWHHDCSCAAAGPCCTWWPGTLLVNAPVPRTSILWSGGDVHQNMVASHQPLQHASACPTHHSACRWWAHTCTAHKPISPAAQILAPAVCVQVHQLLTHASHTLAGPL